MERLAVIGLGYTGLPLAREACAAGMRVTGMDTNPAVTATLESGRSPLPDVTEADVKAMRAAGFHATTDPGVLAGHPSPSSASRRRWTTRAVRT